MTASFASISSILNQIPMFSALSATARLEHDVINTVQRLSDADVL